MTVRLGMVGGGPGAFIGSVHRAAAALDGRMRLMAGAFSRDAARSAEQGRALGLPPERAYASYVEMAEAEAALPAGERIEVVSIVTPNHLHFDVARTFLDAGFHVVCDKPLTTTLDDAEALCRRVADTGRVFGVTFNYTGYPMVKEARARVRAGELGEVRKVVVEYAQGWLATDLESTGHRQAEWRTDPARAGPAGALGDIGSHADNLARYVTGLRPEALCADLTTFVPGRRLDDDAGVLLRFEGGARGVLVASQVSVGEENALSLRVYGTRASLAWRQEAPNALRIRPADGPPVRITRGQPFLSDEARSATRLPPGHPEGFLEAFANVYAAVADAVETAPGAAAPGSGATDFPTVWDGARSVHFVTSALASAEAGGWVECVYDPPGEPGT